MFEFWLLQKFCFLRKGDFLSFTVFKLASCKCVCHTFQWDKPKATGSGRGGKIVLMKLLGAVRFLFCSRTTNCFKNIVPSKIKKTLEKGFSEKAIVAFKNNTAFILDFNNITKPV